MRKSLRQKLESFFKGKVNVINWKRIYKNIEKVEKVQRLEKLLEVQK